MRLPNRLSYQRSISPGIAVFYSVDEQGNQKPLEINTVKILGQKGGPSEAFANDMSLKKGVDNKKLSEGNPHTIDYCYAPADAKHTLCKFSLSVDASSIEPRACNDDGVRSLLTDFAAEYRKLGGYRYLAERYLNNVLSGNWLWRNQKTLDTTIKIQSSGGLQCSIKGVNRKRFEPNWIDEITEFDGLVNEFENALVDPRKYLFLEVTAELSLPLASEIYPSQAFVEQANKLDRSRTYQDTMVEGKRTAIIGAYKIGAAIATIDDWFDGADIPVRVGSFAVDKDRATVYRHPESKKDFYTLLSGLEQLNSRLKSKKKMKSSELNDAHFIAANLVKGGLFSLGSK